MKQNLEQLSMFEDIPDEPVAEVKNTPKECPFKNDSKFSRNTNLCDIAVDCSHCYINDFLGLIRKNSIQKRKQCSVFYCKHVVKDTETEEGPREFAHKCEITGNRWKSGCWNFNEDYNTHPLTSPCSFCDLPSCDKCVFRKEVTPENPHGCCGSCAHRLYCSESKHKDAGSLTVEQFIEMSKKEFRYPELLNDGYTADFSKGPLKKSYSSSCPNYSAYMCTGVESFVKCSCTDVDLTSDVYRNFCEHNHDNCPIYKNKLKEEQTNGE